MCKHAFTLFLAVDLGTNYGKVIEVKYTLFAIKMLSKESSFQPYTIYVDMRRRYRRFTKNVCINERHSFVKGNNLTNTTR